MREPLDERWVSFSEESALLLKRVSDCLRISDDLLRSCEETVTTSVDLVERSRKLIDTSKGYLLDLRRRSARKRSNSHFRRAI